MNCEICGKEITINSGVWGIQIAKSGVKFECHYYCSIEHAKEGEKKFSHYKTVGAVTDAK